MLFWEKRPAMRMVLMLLFFAIGIALIILGWRMTGQLAGLGVMLLGLLLLLATLLLYNKPFETAKTHKQQNNP